MATAWGWIRDPKEAAATTLVPTGSGDCGGDNAIGRVDHTSALRDPRVRHASRSQTATYSARRLPHYGRRADQAIRPLYADIAQHHHRARRGAVPSPTRHVAPLQ